MDTAYIKPPAEDPTVAPVQDAKRFLLAGNAYFTVVSKASGTRFTFHVRQPARPNAPHFVSVLNGPDNEHDYAFLGTIFDGASYQHGRKSRVSEEAPAAKAARWFCTRALQGKSLDQVEVYHEGRCGRCGRKLTVPESIEAGFGPECINLS